MSVDVTAYTMYGKEFDSFGDVVDFLLNYEYITEEEADESNECGEIAGKNLPNIVSYQTYTHYAEHGGVLGVEISAREAIEKNGEVRGWMGTIEGVLGTGCDIHSFCQWH